MPDGADIAEWGYTVVGLFYCIILLLLFFFFFTSQPHASILISVCH